MAGLMYPGGETKPKSGSVLGFYYYDSAYRFPTIDRACNTKYMSSGRVFIKKCNVKVTVYISNETYLISISVTCAGQTIVSYTHSAHQNYTIHTKTLMVNPGDSINVVVSPSQANPAAIVITEVVD